jgi:hypothetical protein
VLSWDYLYGVRASRVRYRVRTETVLVIDGDVIDLNRIQLPPDTPIIDRRWEVPPSRPATRPSD